MASRDQPDNRQQQRIKQEQQDARGSDRGRQQDRGKEPNRERQQANHAADKQQQQQQGRQRQPDPSRGGDKAGKPTAPAGGSKQAAGGSSNNSRDPKSAQGRSSARPSSPPRDLKNGRGSSKDASKPTKEREVARSSKAPSSSTRDERHQEQPRDRGRARSRSRERAVQGQKDKGRDSGRQQDRDRERTRDRDREHEQERDRDRRRDPGREREREREPGRGRLASPPATQRPAGTSGGQARNRAAPAAAIGPGPFSVVDKFLDKQKFVQEVLPPTPNNVSIFHVAGDELISFIKVQQWVEEKCGFALPLLSGIFVLVSSDDVPELSSKDVMDKCGYGKRGSSSGGGGSSSFAKDVATVIPWRLRQVEQVEVKPGEAAERARLLLEGGGCVEASQVRADTMVDVADYEYLCCELAHLQEARHMRALRVYDVAHLAWRMRLTTELEGHITEYKTRQAELKEAGYDAEMLEEVERGSLDEIRGTIKKLPPLTFVDGEIMTYVELNPFARPEFPAESQGPLSRDQVESLMRCASDAWRHYVKNKLEGRPTQPVTEYVPWKPLPAGQVEALPDAAAVDQGDAGMQYGAQGYQEPFTAQQGEPAAVNAAGLQGQALQQQPGVVLQLDIDDYEDDYGFFDDPLAPVEPVGLQLPGLYGLPMAGSAAGLPGPPSGSGAVLPKGLLGAGMSLAPTPSSANAQLHTALSGGLFAAAGSMDAGAAGAQAAAAAADGTRGADYSYWVERGNAAAAATDPRRARAANRTGLAGLPSDPTQPGPLGPMWGGAKPPPGMADAGRPSKQQQDSSTQGGSGGRVSALDRLGPSGAARDRSRDRREDREPRGRHDPSAFSIDARNRGRQPGGGRAGSRSPPPRGRDGGSGGSRGRSRSRSPRGGSPPRRRPRVRRFVTPPPSPRRGRDNTDGSPESGRRQAAAAAASSPPGRHGATGRGQSPRGRDHSPAKAHSSPGRGFSPSAGRGRGRESSRDGGDRDRGRSGSPGSSKRRRDGDSRDAGKQRPASPDGSKRRRRDSTGAAAGDADAGRGRQPSDRDPTSRRSRGAAADADAAAAADGARAAASSPVRDPEAVARRFDGRLENLDVVIADMQLEKDVKAWLRQLAEFLGPPPRPLEQPTPVKLGTLVKQLPLPGHIIRHYSSMTSFVQQRPELSFVTDRSHIQLLPQFHADLLAARKTPSPLPPPPGAAAGEGSDEDYLAGYRGSRRRGSAGRQDSGKKGPAAEAGRDNKASGGSGGRAAGSRSGEQQQQRDEQVDRGGGGAAAAAAAGGAGGGGGSTARREPPQEPPSRPSSRKGPRPESGEGRRRHADGAGRGGWADNQRAPVLTVEIADRVLREFGHKLSVALDASPGGRVPERLAYELMPLPLADRVKAGSKLSLMKLLDDYYPSFELRRDGPTGPPWVMRHPNPGRNHNKWMCKFWDPIKLDGCAKGQVCDFKHDLVPADRF